MSADDNAPEQARDDVLNAHEWRGGYFCSCGHELNSPWGFNRHLVEALEPALAAERQEAARAALLAAAGDIAERIAAVVDPDSWRRDGFDEGWAHAGEKIDGLLRARADGVTGRSGT